MPEMVARGGARLEIQGTGLTYNAFARLDMKKRLPLLAIGISVMALLAGCATEPTKVAMRSKPKSKEYFAETVYGVKASPRVIATALHLPGTEAKRLPRGGGRDQVGKPYKVRGKWYYPKEDSGYDRKGTASWYGDAFHGRLTANGEIYDMNHLSAAHPTMPLPSYARVTNLKNGNSVIVRVNDRGPYAHGRLIDLSKRAANLLDYASSGTAQVRVEYVGRAPVDGADDNYLMASYRPGEGGQAPEDAMQPNVMVAMAGPTPTQAASPVVFEGEQSLVSASMTSDGSDPFALMVDSVMVPDVGPVVPDKPGLDPMSGTPVAASQVHPATASTLISSYADQRVEAAYGSAAPFAVLQLSDERIKASWKRQNASTYMNSSEYILLGSFSKSVAADLVSNLSSIGKVVAEQEGEFVSLRLVSDGREELDGLLRKSWDAGATDAFVVRD
jgi:rare lipoprotein A